MCSNLNSHITSYILQSHIIIIGILAKHLLICNEGYHTYAKLASMTVQQKQFEMYSFISSLHLIQCIFFKETLIIWFSLWFTPVHLKHHHWIH